MSFYTLERAMEILGNMGARVKLSVLPRPGGGIDVGANVFFPKTGEEREITGRIIETVSQELVSYAQEQAIRVRIG